MHPETTEDFKELGNTAVKNGQFEEAVLHYSSAIKLDPTSFTLFSNRSYAFLKMQQYNVALVDACETIRLNPTWAKGYFRKGEVEFATYHFMDAYKSYKEALFHKPDDNNLVELLEKARKENLKDLKADEQIPWLGAGIGIVLGAVIVIADFLLTNKPTHPLIMAVITVLIAVAGYGLAKVIRYYVKMQRDALLEKPIDLTEENAEGEASEEIKNTKPRYSKSQARQRYKKGKM